MKNKLSLTLALLALTFTLGCKSPGITKITVQTAVATGVSFGVERYPDAVPYLRAAAPIICSAASGTNLSPAQVVAALESSTVANQVKTPQGALILNGALVLYITLYDEYGTDYVANHELLQSWLLGTCAGIQQGLPASGLAKPLASTKPHIK